MQTQIYHLLIDLNYSTNNFIICSNSFSHRPNRCCLLRFTSDSNFLHPRFWYSPIGPCGIAPIVKLRWRLGVGEALSLLSFSCLLPFIRTMHTTWKEEPRYISVFLALISRSLDFPASHTQKGRPLYLLLASTCSRNHREVLHILDDEQQPQTHFVRPLAQ